MIGAWKSLAIPAALSLSGTGATYYAFDYQDKLAAEAAANEDQGEAIAYLEATTSGIERRPGRRIVWQTIENGNAIYQGDAIRTPPAVEGNVQLIQGNTTVILEPDSLIVLEDEGEGLQLNLLSGSLLVEKNEDPSPKKSSGKRKKNTKAPIIKAGNTKISLKGKDTQLNLSKKKGAEATVAVVKGNVDVDTKKGKVNLGAGRVGKITDKGVEKIPAIEVSYPPANGNVFVTSGNGRNITFKWKPLKRKDLRVRLLVGSSRNSLTRTNVSIPADKGALTYQPPMGTFYWKLIAVDKTGAEKTTSIPMRANAVLQVAPTPYEPLANEPLVRQPGDLDVQFRWSAPPKVAGTTLEVARDPGFKKVIANKKFTQENFHILSLPEEGSYYWRVKARWAGSKKVMVSKSRSFSIRNIRAVAIPSPEEPPVGFRSTQYRASKRGILFSWSKDPAPVRYHLQVWPQGEVGQGKPVVDRQVGATGFKAKGIKPGKYQWRVRAFSTENESDWSEIRRFQVDPIGTISWNDNTWKRSEGSHQYDTKKPTVKLSWDRGPRETVAWRVRYASLGTDIRQASWRNVQQPTAEFTLPRDGKWVYEAEAIAEDGAVLARTAARELLLEPIPVTAGPVLLGDDLEADGFGRVRLAWANVPKATSYEVNVKDASGQTKQLKTDAAQYSLADLMPGTYLVSLRSFNRRGVPGPEGETRRLIVPDESQVAAPRFKNFEMTGGASETFGKRPIRLAMANVRKASSYDLEVVQEDGEVVATPNIPKSGGDLVWASKLNPGDYTVRMRSKDKRGVAGKWSSTKPFSVQFPRVAAISPKKSARYNSDSDDEAEIEFEWKEFKTDATYLLEVLNENGDVVAKEETDSDSADIDLAVAKRYSWRVTAISPKGKKGDKWTETRPLTVVGGPLDEPEITKEYDEDSEAILIEWEGPKQAQNYAVKLAFKGTGESGWENIVDDSAFKKTELSLGSDMPQGEYKLTLVSQGNLWQSSSTTEYSFERRLGTLVKNKDRVSPHRFAVKYDYIPTIRNIQTQSTDIPGLDFTDLLSSSNRFGLGYSFYMGSRAASTGEQMHRFGLDFSYHMIRKEMFNSETSAVQTDGDGQQPLEYAANDASFIGSYHFNWSVLQLGLLGGVSGKTLPILTKSQTVNQLELEHHTVNSPLFGPSLGLAFSNGLEIRGQYLTGSGSTDLLEEYERDVINVSIGHDTFLNGLKMSYFYQGDSMSYSYRSSNAPHVASISDYGLGVGIGYSF